MTRQALDDIGRVLQALTLLADNEKMSEMHWGKDENRVDLLTVFKRLCKWREEQLEMWHVEER